MKNGIMKNLRFVEKAFLIELMNLTTTNTINLSLRTIGVKLNLPHQTVSNYIHTLSEVGLIEVFSNKNKCCSYRLNTTKINKVIND